MKLLAILFLLPTLALADCERLPHVIERELAKTPELALARKSSEKACEAVGMCSSRVMLRGDGQAFMVECVNEEEWSAKLKEIKASLPPEM